jgi:hypothetical protein
MVANISDEPKDLSTQWRGRKRGRKKKSEVLMRRQIALENQRREELAMEKQAEKHEKHHDDISRQISMLSDLRYQCSDNIGNSASKTGGFSKIYIPNMENNYSRYIPATMENVIGQFSKIFGRKSPDNNGISGHNSSKDHISPHIRNSTIFP